MYWKTIYLTRIEVNVPDNISIEQFKVSAYTVPTDLPEADGTIEWNSTTMVLVEIEAGGKKGLGYTYAHEATAVVIYKTLKQIVIGKNAMNIEGITFDTTKAIRNNGNCGIAAMAVSAVDNALWDLKAKVLGLPLCVLLGQVKNAMPVYGSGGFTSYTEKELQDQLAGWANEGLQSVKMKIGAQPQNDAARVKIARKAIGENTGLFVDANGAYSVKEALNKAKAFAEYDVEWYEEPVTSANVTGLRFIREHAPKKMNIAAGEYGYNLTYFDTMLHEGAVDILQADATRCGGISNFMKAGSLAEAYQVPFSSHCAPSLHLHAALALPSFYIAEYFHDHIRIEKMFFDGITLPVKGLVYPDMSRHGFGLTIKEKDILKYKI